MRKSSLITLVACMISFGSMIFGQENLNKNKPLPKDHNSPKIMTAQKEVCRSPLRMPLQVIDTFKFFKIADELELTNDQIIKLREFYKKHYSEKANKLEVTKPLTMYEYYYMSEKELNKYASDEAERRRKELMLKFQRVIDIKKILTPDQLEKLKKLALAETEKAAKKIEELKANKNKPAPTKIKFRNPCKLDFSNLDRKKENIHKHHHKHIGFPRNMMAPHMQPMYPPCGNMMSPMMNPMFHQHGMMPQMNPMFHQHGMMPHMNPMFQQQGMMVPHMQPMFPPPCGMMLPNPQHNIKPVKPVIPSPKMMDSKKQPICPPPCDMMSPMNPMFPQQGMMAPHNMQPMCPPPCGMMPYMMNPMFQQQGMMTPHMQPMYPPCGMMPHMMNPMFQHKFGMKHNKNFEKKPLKKDLPEKTNFNKRNMPKPPFGFPPFGSKMKSPFDMFLMKFFGCQKDCDSDIMKAKKCDEISKEK